MEKPGNAGPVPEHARYPLKRGNFCSASGMNVASLSIMHRDPAARVLAISSSRSGYPLARRESRFRLPKFKVARRVDSRWDNLSSPPSFPREWWSFRRVWEFSRSIGDGSEGEESLDGYRKALRGVSSDTRLGLSVLLEGGRVSRYLRLPEFCGTELRLDKRYSQILTRHFLLSLGLLIYNRVSRCPSGGSTPSRIFKVEGKYNKIESSLYRYFTGTRKFRTRIIFFDPNSRVTLEIDFVLRGT